MGTAKMDFTLNTTLQQNPVDSYHFSPVTLLRMDGLSSSEVSTVRGENMSESKFLSSPTIRMLPVSFQSGRKETQHIKTVLVLTSLY